MAELADSVARRYAVLRPHLNEFQRRLWLGAEAAELGPGGVAVVAKATGVAADTVRRGRKEAGEGALPGSGRSRQAGDAELCASQPLTILVNNAGVAHYMPIADLSAAQPVNSSTSKWLPPRCSPAPQSQGCWPAGAEPSSTSPE